MDLDQLAWQKQAYLDLHCFHKQSGINVDPD